MKCAKCQSGVRQDEAHKHNGQTLCDDCCMDALSPVRTCDPWAIHSAKRLKECTRTSLAVNGTQDLIMRFLRESGDTEPPVLCLELGLDQDRFQREIAALRHAEKVRGRLKEGKAVLSLW
jgi:hypothetical protein